MALPLFLAARNQGIEGLTASERQEIEAKASKRGIKQRQALADLADPLLHTTSIVFTVSISFSHRLLMLALSMEHLHMQTCGRPYERPASMHCKCRWRLNGPLQCPSRPHRNRQHDRGDLNSPRVARDSLLVQLAGAVLPFGNAFWR